MGRIEELDARIHERMAAMDKRIADRMAALDARLGCGSSGHPSAVGMVKSMSMNAMDQAEESSNFLGSAEDQWNFDDERIFRLWNMVRYSKLVENNDQYRYIAGGIQFNVLHSGFSIGDTDGDHVNACALEGSPIIYLCSGESS